MVVGGVRGVTLASSLSVTGGTGCPVVGSVIGSPPSVTGRPLTDATLVVSWVTDAELQAYENDSPGASALMVRPHAGVRESVTTAGLRLTSPVLVTVIRQAAGDPWSTVWCLFQWPSLRTSQSDTSASMQTCLMIRISGCRRSSAMDRCRSVW